MTNVSKKYGKITRWRSDNDLTLLPDSFSTAKKVVYRLVYFVEDYCKNSSQIGLLILFWPPETNSWSSGLHPTNMLLRKAVVSAGKVLPRIFYDSQGDIYIDYLEKDKTVTVALLLSAEILGDFEFQKNFHIWQIKKYSSTMTTPRLTTQPSPRSNWFS